MKQRIKLCLFGAALVAIGMLSTDVALRCFSFLGASVCLIHGICDFDPVIKPKDSDPDIDV